MKLTDIFKTQRIDESLGTAYDAIATDDFQGRHGSYPRGNVPDTIDVNSWDTGATATFAFKNTNPAAAENWVARYLASRNLPYDTIKSSQVGDYEDDWVEVFVRVEQSK